MISLFPSWRLTLSIIGAFLLIITLLLWEAQKNPKTLQCTVFDLPGESIFCHTPEGQNILIDAGETNAIAYKLPEVLPFWDRNIDLLVLTHTDRDHLFGAQSVIEEYQVKHLYLAGTHHDSGLTQDFLDAVETKRIPITIASPKRDLRFSNIIFDTLWPHTVLGKSDWKTNDYAVVQRMRFGNTSVLFTGDIEKKTEEAILRTPVRLRSDILKIAHHGSKTSSSPDFLSAIQAKNYLIAAHQENRFGHPNQEVIERLLGSVYITKEKGDLSLTIHNNSFSITP